MKNEDIVRETEEYVRGHVPTSRKPDEDYFNHIFGARKFAKKLAKEYKADEFIVDLAILLHDIGANAGATHAQKSAEMAQKFLETLEVDHAAIAKIVDCIKSHSMGSKVDTLEQQIIQDADGLIFIEDSFKYFYEEGKRIHSSETVAKKDVISKTTGMTAKIKTPMGCQLAEDLLPRALFWIESK